MKIFIGCSSNPNIPQSFFEDCEKFLKQILLNNDIVFGVCSDGLMGTVYRVAKQNGNKIIGICPKIYKDNFISITCDEKILTDSIFERIDRIIDESDAIVFLPGGIGTLHELFSFIELKRNNQFDKPIIIYNYNHFFDELILFFEKYYIVFRKKQTKKPLKI